jgi:glycosyltransferase involved in cell wall biosynthesis
MEQRITSTDVGAPDTITACIIACNEAERLPDCLSSVAFCDEIVLVDSGSTDATIQIARAAGALVVEQPWHGFAAQRNIALDHAHGAWVLEIDADERITPRLRAEIEAFLAASPPGVNLGGLPLREVFLGRLLGPSAKYPKYRLRLLRRGAYRHDENRTVHEGLVPQSKVHPFEGDLLHLLATSWREAAGDAWRYSGLEAGQLRAPRTLQAFVKAIVIRPAAKFGYRLAVDGGWRDGWPGVAKIAIDCATDSIVWVRYITGLDGHESGNSGVDSAMHYGTLKVHRGSIRIVGVAVGRVASAQARRWLTQAAASGADVALIAAGVDAEPLGDQASFGRDVRVHPLDGFGPLALIRALDAEEQLRTLDAVVPFGRRATLLLHAVPRGLRGYMREVTPDVDPGAIQRDSSARGEAVLT